MSDRSCWNEDLRARLEQAVRMRGMNRTADEIPAARSTVHRLIRGDTVSPSLAVAEGVERVVESVVPVATR